MTQNLIVAPPTQGTWYNDDYVSAFKWVDIGVALPTQGTWRSNDNVITFRLVDILFVFYERDGYYILHE